MENVCHQIFISSMMYKILKVRDPDYEVPGTHMPCYINDFTEI
jgi:hypothetical protein